MSFEKFSGFCPKYFPLNVAKPIRHIWRNKCSKITNTSLPLILSPTCTVPVFVDCMTLVIDMFWIIIKMSLTPSQCHLIIINSFEDTSVQDSGSIIWADYQLMLKQRRQLWKQCRVNRRTAWMHSFFLANRIIENSIWIINLIAREVHSDKEWRNYTSILFIDTNELIESKTIVTFAVKHLNYLIFQNLLIY